MFRSPDDPAPSHSELIWILDDDQEAVALYKQTLGLQYRLRILESFEQLQSELRAQPNPGDSSSWLLITDPENIKKPMKAFFGGDAESAGIRLPECIVVSNIDDLDLIRFYLKAGARDYLLKPIRPNELVAKVEKALQSINNREILILRNDLDGLQVNNLTFKEHQLLTVFLSREDRSVKRGDLYGAIWNKVNVNRKTLDVHLFNLRRKLRPHGYDIHCQHQTFSLRKQAVGADTD